MGGARGGGGDGWPRVIVPRGRCPFCGTEVVSGQAAAFRECGWADERPKGTHNLRLVERSGIAHLVCVEREQRRQRFGIGGGQLDLGA